MRNPSRRTVLLGTAGVGLAGCANGSVVGFDKAARALDIANSAEPLSLDPHRCSSAAEANIVGNLFVGLTTENARAEPIPGMAERWETSKDGLIWTFYLRPAVWSDGMRCDAHDFAFAFRRVLDPATRAEGASLLYAIKNAERVNSGALSPSTLGVTALGDRVLEIRLEHPATYLPYVLKHHAAYPVPKHLLERAGDAWVKPEHLAVNGPFGLVKWWANSIVHLRKNPHFWEAEQVGLNDLYFYPSADPDAAARAVLSGERGWSTDFPAEMTADLRRRAPGYVRIAPSLLLRCFFFNCTRAPFNDARVRCALSMALDRERLREAPAYAYVPPGVANDQSAARYSWSGAPLAARRAEALRLLQEAGYGPGRPLRFTLTRQGADSPSAAVLAAQADWRAIAPWVAVEQANAGAGAFDCAEGAWAAPYKDARPYLQACRDLCGYASPQFDALLAQADAESDAENRAPLLAAAEQAALDDAPICSVSFGASRNLAHPDLAGFADNIEDVHRARWFGVRV